MESKKTYEDYAKESRFYNTDELPRELKDLSAADVVYVANRKLEKIVNVAENCNATISTATFFIAAYILTPDNGLIDDTKIPLAFIHFLILAIASLGIWISRIRHAKYVKRTLSDYPELDSLPLNSLATFPLHQFNFRIIFHLSAFVLLLKLALDSSVHQGFFSHGPLTGVAYYIAPLLKAFSVIVTSVTVILLLLPVYHYFCYSLHRCEMRRRHYGPRDIINNTINNI